MRTIRNVTLTLGLAVCVATLSAEPIAVRQSQGLTRGFLIMHSLDGKVLGTGELIQTAHGEHLTTRVVFHLRDGSIDEDTASFIQHGTLQLETDHHIQKGPFFKKPSDLLIDMASGNVTSRSIDKDGKEKIEVEHMDLPNDVYNGLMEAVLLNVAHDTPEFKVGMVLPSGKGRLVKLAIRPDGEGTFSAVGLRHKATIFRIKIELGGVAGVIAPIVGKQPADTMVWIVEGEAPGFVRQIGQLSEDGPIVSIELSGTSFPRSAPKNP